MNRELIAKAMTRSFVRMSYLLLDAFYSMVLPNSTSQAGAVSEIGALPRFSGQLHHVQPRFPGIRNRAGRAIGMEIEDQILARIVTRPSRQARTIWIAGPGEVDPVALRHTRDRLVLGCRRWWWRPEESGTQGAEHECDFTAVQCPGAKHFPHRGRNIGEPVEIDGRTVGREGSRCDAGRLGLAKVVVCPRYQRGQIRRPTRIVSRLRLCAPLAEPSE